MSPTVYLKINCNDFFLVLKWFNDLNLCFRFFWNFGQLSNQTRGASIHRVWFWKGLRRFPKVMNSRIEENFKIFSSWNMYSIHENSSCSNSCSIYYTTEYSILRHVTENFNFEMSHDRPRIFFVTFSLRPYCIIGFVFNNYNFCIPNYVLFLHIRSDDGSFLNLTLELFRRKFHKKFPRSIVPYQPYGLISELYNGLIMKDFTDFGRNKQGLSKGALGLLGYLKRS